MGIDHYEMFNADLNKRQMNAVIRLVSEFVFKLKSKDGWRCNIFEYYNSIGFQVTQNQFEASLREWLENIDEEKSRHDLLDEYAMIACLAKKHCKGRFDPDHEEWSESDFQCFDFFKSGGADGTTFFHDVLNLSQINRLQESYTKARMDANARFVVEQNYERRRAEANEVISSPKLRTLIMERDGAKCRWCGETDDLALDHVVPVVAGGTDDPENLQLLCRSCNSSKGDRVPSSAKLPSRKNIFSDIKQESAQ